jgi:hypothetical protein
MPIDETLHVALSTDHDAARPTSCSHARSIGTLPQLSTRWQHPHITPATL